MRRTTRPCGFLYREAMQLIRPDLASTLWSDEPQRLLWPARPDDEETHHDESVQELADRPRRER